MKPKLNKNLSLPWTPHGEKASGTISSHEKNYELIFTISLSGFVFPCVLYQFVDLADSAVGLELACNGGSCGVIPLKRD